MASSLSYSITKDKLRELSHQNPFSHDLGIKIIPSKHEDTHVTICCHGYGHNHEIVDIVNSYDILEDHLIGFNFPDHNILYTGDYATCAFGTINEILPLLYIVKRCVSDLEMPVINIYGFSAGGGAVVNMLAILNQSIHDTQLEKIGITQQVKKKIVDALKKGLIILDCPLKSVEEIIDARGSSPELALVASKFVQNDMRPIDTVTKLHGLPLNILLSFQVPDETLSNRDDALFISRLRAANQGKTWVVIASDGGHNAAHTTLWDYYKKIRS
jgi:hypothetical protein